MTEVSRPSSASGLPLEDVAKLTARVTAASVVVAVVLAGLKSLAWIESGSVALLASLADSALDFIAAMGSFVAVRYATAPPDAEHRYGHGKAEAFASLLQAGLVFASAALVGQEAVARLLHPEPIRAEGWALGVMCVSTVLLIGLVSGQSWVLRRARSPAVSSDRMHYVADLGCNAAALVGVAAAIWLGEPRWDAAAGLAVILWLLWGAVSVLKEAADHLMDRELPDDERRRIVELAGDDPKVLGVHQVRTRASGPFVHVQMHMDLDPDQSLEQAHKVVEAAESRILSAFPSADVLIHPDPRGRAETHGESFFDSGALSEDRRRRDRRDRARS